ncbi:MAG TPA: glutaredoxin family protein [Pantanalinema sp.]
MPRLTLYSGPGCCLCDQAKALLDKVAADQPFQLDIVDIHSDAALYERFRYAIPVIAVDGEVVMAGKVTEFWIRKALRGEPLGREARTALASSARG